VCPPALPRAQKSGRLLRRSARPVWGGRYLVCAPLPCRPLCGNRSTPQKQNKENTAAPASSYKLAGAGFVFLAPRPCGGVLLFCPTP